MTREMENLEEDIERSRVKLDQALERLQKRLTVTGVVDDALGIARAGPYSSLYEKMLTVIRRNPVPVLLATAGVGFLLQQMRKDTRKSQSLQEGHFEDAEGIETPLAGPNGPPRERRYHLEGDNP